MVGHDTKVAKSHSTLPNVWFVGVTPRRNPELVVAVLWQNGSFSYYPARIGAKVVSAYVEKQRRLAHNLMPPKMPAAAAPVEVGAVWSAPQTDAEGAGQDGEPATRMQGGRFLVDAHGIVAEKQAASAGPSVQKGGAKPGSGPGIHPELAKSSGAPAAPVTPRRGNVP